MRTSSWSEHSYLPFWLYVFPSRLNIFSSKTKIIWFGSGRFLLARKIYSKSCILCQHVYLMSYPRCLAFKWNPQNNSMISINYNSLSGYDILYRSTILLQLQPFSCQHTEQHISKRNHEIIVVILKKWIYIYKLKLQRWSLEFIIFFAKIYIWDLGVRFG